MINIASALLVAVCTAVVTVWLSLRRFHAERWWERKADVYSRIVEALHALMEYCAATSAAELGVTYSEERKKELGHEYNRAYIELRKATGIGSYIISDQVADVLARLEARPRLDPHKEPFFEVLDADREAYEKALSQIRSLAKIDLGVTGRSVSGFMRLGAVLSGLWLLLAPVAYFAALTMNLTPFTAHFRIIFDWVTGTLPDPGDPNFIPDVPVADVPKLVTLCVLPVLIGWLALFALPSAVGWVRAGFHNDRRNA